MRLGTWFILLVMGLLGVRIWQWAFDLCNRISWPT